MDIIILGCRGSYPVASPDLKRYGGDTTSIYVQSGQTAVVLDAGTGIRHLKDLPAEVRDVHLFITHLHWDHIMGFPQWSLLSRRRDVQLHIYSIARSHDKFYSALERSISQPFYTHSLDELFSTFRFYELNAGSSVELPDLKVSCALANHPYRALAYRVEDKQQKLAFVPDTAPFDRYLFDDDIVLKDTSLTAPEKQRLVKRYDELLNLAGGVDWLIYDAALTAAEYEMLPHWGHSTPAQAVEVARQTEAGELVLFHHSPTRSDDKVDLMYRETQMQNTDLQISAAFAGMHLRQEAGVL